MRRKYLSVLGLLLVPGILWSAAPATPARVGPVSPFIGVYRPGTQDAPLPDGWGKQLAKGYRIHTIHSLIRSAKMNFPAKSLVILGDKKNILLAPAKPSRGDAIIQVTLIGKKAASYSKKAMTEEMAEKLAGALKARDTAGSVKALGRAFDNMPSAKSASLLIDLEESYGILFKTSDGLPASRQPKTARKELRNLNDARIADDLVSLEKRIGKKNVERLKRGWLLHQWRRTSPHNWWFSPPGKEYPSENLDRSPGLFLFEPVSDSQQRIIHYFGSDSGQPEETVYRLRPEISRQLLKK